MIFTEPELINHKWAKDAPVCLRCGEVLSDEESSWLANLGVCSRWTVVDEAEIEELLLEYKVKCKAKHCNRHTDI